MLFYNPTFVLNPNWNNNYKVHNMNVIITYYIQMKTRKVSEFVATAIIYSIQLCFDFFDTSDTNV